MGHVFVVFKQKFVFVVCGRGGGGGGGGGGQVDSDTGISSWTIQKLVTIESSTE